VTKQRRENFLTRQTQTVPGGSMNDCKIKLATIKNWYLWVTCAILVVFLCLTGSLVGAVLESESLQNDFPSPERLISLLVILASAFFILRLAVRNSQLTKSLHLYAAAMESTVDGIAILDSDFRLVYSNRAHARLYGYETADDLIGKSWQIFYRGELTDRFQSEVKPSLLERGEWRGETIGTKKDGSQFPQEISLSRINDENIIRIVRDSSEKRVYQMELESRARELTDYQSELEGRTRELIATNRELETFSYTLSHDMRGYITRVSSAVQMLLNWHARDFDEDGNFLLHSISNTCKDMEQLVQSIQLMASISQRELRMGPVNLSELVATIASQLHLSEPQRVVEFIIPEGIFANCDAKLARVALGNLFENAWKYSGVVSPARIEFGVEQYYRKRVFFVRDNGLGFDMEEAGRLFEPFQRLQNAKEYPGAGIGLATVQRVIQLHQGELWGIGEPGKGATFYFTLGREPEGGDDAEEPAARPGPAMAD
jgi:PAS domain S-box-containing protein